eukprot:TRINITY_DN18577_c0_g1_i1.p1 TRINITY_DN18577_c0_g1~~TRINITY_DN18577_c0_g1_i1.p1  ORF type:complete len:132 (-),score=60.68 TRINITY_DN18577_c0_g1_i1:309-704(-)
MIRRPPRSTLSSSSAASDVYKRQGINAEYGEVVIAMDGFLSSMQQGAKDLADATERKAKTTKCQAEIMYANRTIAQIKEAFGIKVWDAMLAGDQQTVDAILAESKALVEQQQADIAEKTATIERLSVPYQR